MTDNTDILIDLTYIEDSTSRPSDSCLEFAMAYLKEHGVQTIEKNVIEHRKPGLCILDRQNSSEADLIVLGAHSVSAIRRMTFGPITHDLITNMEIPLFLSP